ncbi:MAG: flagellar biosynthetic protein FliR [Proteobacteria bacterium]|nr:flagellar biosynthetic protein FliR [Pseudomonadota bacterium]MBU1584681.1 flagellar biosynthetic protein FliR [Pseudomonadota bacterium]MBU2455121.1 flagellar biosynthetic protein FliR [Pseudomonadota bacterium]MBU2628597.1 flagellar biosynthetic protein FliR [Pseudomonadota bacterium]
MEILNVIDPVEFRTYLLVLLRISILLFMFPIFSSNVFPNRLKIGFALVVSLLFYSVVEVDVSRFPMSVIATGLLIIAEALIGLTLGLCLRMFFGSVQLAGQIIGFQMGFAMINVLDPQTGSNVSIMDQLGYWVCVIVFLLFNGHHIMFLAVIDSFKLVPIGFFMMQEAMLAKMLDLGAQLFLLAIKIGAPVIASLAFVSVGFGLMAKFSPQMNVMIVAFPLKIIAGLLLFGLVLQIIVIVTQSYIKEFKEILMYFLFFAGGG